MSESDGFLVLLAPLLLIVAVVDARSGRIPNAANAAIALLGLLAVWREAPQALPGRLVDAAILGALLLLLRGVYRKRRRQAGLGLGDVKFLAAATIWTGLFTMPLVILVASGSALAAVGVMRLRGQDVGRQTRLRFGPYLAAALFAILMAGRLGF